VLVGIGGNIGNVPKRFLNLLNTIQKDRRVSLIASSAILKNPPFGIKDQNYFYNSLLLIHTNLIPKRILKLLLHYEKKFGRIRELKNGPRTLDLDIIFINNLYIESKDLVVPHPSYHKRDSVLIPLKILKKVLK